MVGDREVCVPAFARRERHLLERVLAVRPCRMTMEVALDVGQLDELRQLPVPCRFELPGVLSQLRRYERVSEPVVHLRLRSEPQLLTGFDDGDRVLGDGPPTLYRPL